jgi:Cu+-exporting ATPase
MSGDNKAAAQRVGREVGVDEIHAQLLPQDKASLIRRIQRTGNVAMVGDGINDSVAQMQANVGIAMGSGADIAIDSADVIILNNRLKAVLDAPEISRWRYRKMLQNVSLATMFDGISMPLSATGGGYLRSCAVALALHKLCDYDVEKIS